MPEPGAGQLLVRTLWLSLDPYMRLRIAEGGQYYPAVLLGDVMIGGGLSRVVESNHAGFAAGDYIEAYTGWQDYATVGGAEARKVDPALGLLSTALGVPDSVRSTASTMSSSLMPAVVGTRTVMASA